MIPVGSLDTKQQLGGSKVDSIILVLLGVKVGIGILIELTVTKIQDVTTESEFLKIHSSLFILFFHV